jgi:lipopolysaccharide/colanic/teichoic acid biosynthesis glycosyltransferase
MTPAHTMVRVNAFVKRLLDLIVAVLGLMLFGPVMLALWMLVRVKLGAPAFFRQTRPGLHGKPFDIIKFRTMTDATEPDGAPLPDALRLTPFGRWLRSTSMDELPELWNLLRGDMSVVGPRPLLVEYLPLYTPEQSRRHDVRPGITGWAQINGRNAVSWRRKLEMDVWYVENQSIALDLKIFVLTFVRVFKRSGVSAEGAVTAHKFTGRDDD